MFDFAGANAVRQRAKGAVGGGVRIAANHRHTWQGRALLRPNDVDNALTFGQEREVGGRAEFGHVGIQRGDLFFADGVGDAVVAQLPAGGGGVVVSRGDDGADAPDLAARLANALKCLWAGDFMHQVAVNVKHGGAVFFGVDDVFVPDFVVQRAAHGVLQKTYK